MTVSIDASAPDDISPGQPESTCPLSLTELAPGQSCTHVVGYQPSEFFKDRQAALLHIRVYDTSGEVIEVHDVNIRGQGV